MTKKHSFFHSVQTMKPFLRNKGMKKIAVGLAFWGVVGVAIHGAIKTTVRGVDVSAPHNDSDMPIYSLMKPSWASQILMFGDDSAALAFQQTRFHRTSYPFFKPFAEPLYRDYWRWNGFQLLDASDETKDDLLLRARVWANDEIYYNEEKYKKTKSPLTTYDTNSFVGYFVRDNTHDKLRALLALNEYDVLNRDAYHLILNANTAHGELLMVLNERPESVAKLYERLRDLKMTYEIVSLGLTASTQQYGYAAAQYQSVDLLRNYGCVTEADRMEKAFRLEEAYVKTERFMSQGISFKEAGAYGDADFEPLARYKYKEQEWDKGFPQDSDPKHLPSWHYRYQFQNAMTENGIHEKDAIPLQNAIVKSISPQCVARLKSY